MAEPGQATFLADRAQDLLVSARAALAVSRTPNGPPRWSARTHGPPVPDQDIPDDMLAVYSGTPAVLLKAVEQKAARQRGAVHVMPIAQFRVELWRHVLGRDDHGRIPDAEQIDGEAAALMTDGWALASWLLEKNRAGTLFTSPPSALVQPEIGDPTFIPTSGNVAGWRIDVNVPVVGLNAVPA